MGLFRRKQKKSSEELKKAREEKIAATSNSLKLQIVALEKKRDGILKRVVEAKQKGLAEQERQARGLLKQAMAAIKREQGMLMTLELAVESRDLAQINMNFLDSIAALSDDIISSSKKADASQARRVEDKYTRALYEIAQQKERIDDMLSVGEFSSVLVDDGDKYAEFDQEIDSMIESAETTQLSTKTGAKKVRN